MLVRGVGADCRPEKYRHLEQAKWSVLNVEELPLMRALVDDCFPPRRRPQDVNSVVFPSRQLLLAILAQERFTPTLLCWTIPDQDVIVSEQGRSGLLYRCKECLRYDMGLAKRRHSTAQPARRDCRVTRHGKCCVLETGSIEILSDSRPNV